MSVRSGRTLRGMREKTPGGKCQAAGGEGVLRGDHSPGAGGPWALSPASALSHSGSPERQGLPWRGESHPYPPQRDGSGSSRAGVLLELFVLGRTPCLLTNGPPPPPPSPLAGG